MNFNYIGKLSISNFSKKVKNINSWEDYQFRQKTYEVHKYTKTIPLIFDEDFKHKDPTYHKQYNNYKEEIEKIKKVFTKKFGQGYIIRAILVNLPAQKIIPEHIDGGDSLNSCKRIHVPLITNDKILFTVGYETKNLKVGEMWENRELLKLIIPKPKFIILYRPVLECLASFVKITKAKDNEILCEQLLDRDDNFGRSLWSIQNIIKSKEDYILIKYNDFVLNPNAEVKKIFNFLKTPFETLKTSNINQFSINNIEYNDDIFEVPLHTIRTNRIKKDIYKIEDYLPKKLIEKYSEVDKSILQHEYK